MANLPWLDEVLSRLANRGLSPNYVQRLAAELSDHLDDFMEENMSAEADVYSRLGKPEQVADVAVAAYRRRSFLGRHPAAAFLVFGLSPIVSLVLISGCIMLGIWGFDEAGKWMGVDMEQGLRNLKHFEPAASAVMPYALSLLVVVIPSILASVLYCVLARRSGIGRKWIVVSCIVLAVAALVPICTAELSDVPGKSRLMVGAWNPFFLEHLWGSIVWSFSSPRQLLQFLVPLAAGLWFMRRRDAEVRLRLAP